MSIVICSSSEPALYKRRKWNQHLLNRHIMRNQTEVGPSKQSCKYCVGSRKKLKCPSLACPKCKKMGHLPNVCRSSSSVSPSTPDTTQHKPKKTFIAKQNRVREEASSDASIYSIREGKSQYFAELQVKLTDSANPAELRVQLDS